MWTRASRALATVGILAVAALSGCGGTEQYGSGVTLTDATPVADILADPASHDGQSVRIEGRIVTECPTGCWFEIGEAPAVLYVDLAPNGLAIPQRVGSKAVVEGTVSVTDGQPKLLGRGVEIR